ncbi:MAG TPA: DUF488 domain-containing protein [Polyangiaceae bacterium]|nr:DUF488 domain-containing protein [Polyangiaceae bacterium]
MRTAQRVLLEFLGEHEGISEPDVHGLLFRYCQGSAQPAYDFVLYAERAHSFTAAADLEKLIQKGVVERDSGRLRLRASAPGTLPAAEPRVEHRHQPIGTPLSHEASPSSGLCAPPLCTIGYEGRSLENYLNRLLTARVSTLCDVRRNPLSRKFGFSKGTLSRACCAVGIEYEHLPELGIASEQRRHIVTDADRQALFREYAGTTLAAELVALDRIGARLEAGQRVALTCYEERPEDCHRNALARALSARFDVPSTAHL